MHRIRIFLVVMSVLLLPTVAKAQMKLSGTVQCSKPDPQHTLEVGDHPNHFFTVGQANCTWTEPWEIEGIKSKEGDATQLDEMSRNSSNYRGYYLDTMADGDNVYYSYGGTTTLKDGVPVDAIALRRKDARAAIEAGRYPI